MNALKICSRCNRQKPVTEFKSDSRKPDGKASSCKACNTGVAYASPGQLAELGTYDQARALLAQAKAVDEVKAILDKTAALKEYARRAADRTLEIDATEIRFYAERRMGEMLIAQSETVGFNSGARGQLRGREKSGGTITASPEDERPTLADVGISRKLSSHAQKLAAVPAKEFQSRIESWRAEVSAGQARVTVDLMRIGQAEQRRENAQRLAEELSANSKPLNADRRYAVIYADPATRFKAGFSSRSIENHYPTDDIDAWCKLPVRDIAWTDSLLFCWTTVPHLANTINLLLPAWGFDYKSCLCWDKVVAGTGYWARNQHELLLIATRGSPPLPAPADVPASVHAERKGDHSAKPDYYHELIERMTPGRARIELFARGTREGWASWGNQAHAQEPEPA